MRQKISLKQLAEKVASDCGVNVEFAEGFIKHIFSSASKHLEERKPVEIPGLGIFSNSDDSSMPVKFIPDVNFAALINQPFAMFSPEEISDDFDVSELIQIEEQIIEPISVADEIHTEKQEPVALTELSLDIPTIDEEKQLIADNATVISHQESVESVVTVKETLTDDTEVEEIPALSEIDCLPEDEEEIIEYQVVKSNFGVGLLTGLFIGLALSAIAFTLYILYWAH